MNPRRVRMPTPPHPTGPVLYWMHREFRISDNWALIHAQNQALNKKCPLAIVCCLTNDDPEATQRQDQFLLRGLEELAATLPSLEIPLVVFSGAPETEIITFASAVKASLVVTDFDPLRIKRRWIDTLSTAIPLHEVDSRNIVPCWIASDKREYMAKTIRPKIKRHLTEFLTPFPDPRPHPHPWTQPLPEANFSQLQATLRTDTAVPPVPWPPPGERSGNALLETFCSTRLPSYLLRNDPNKQVCSDLSAHLHFGMISAQRVALHVMQGTLHGDHVDAFLEELIVRRELADNFCFHTPDYDQVSGFPGWAQETLAVHELDQRPHVYSEEELESAQTHDPLWNAAQAQMIATGKMHGYLRMYWAKKILEWTPNVRQALRIAIRLNNRYSLDGRDTNGYTGIAWSLGGVHDRGWTERPVFGKIRYMNFQGARRKFDVDKFVRTWISPPLPGTRSPYGR